MYLLLLKTCPLLRYEAISVKDGHFGAFLQNELPTDLDVPPCSVSSQVGIHMVKGLGCVLS